MVEDTIAVVKTGLAFTKRFYFGAGEYNSSRVFIVEEVFEICLPVFDFHW
jgi:hypothetical protein